MLDWLDANKQWLVPGGGVALATAVAAAVRWAASRRTRRVTIFDASHKSRAEAILFERPSSEAASSPARGAGEHGDAYCSFCGRPRRQARHLVHSHGIYICDRCADTTGSIVEGARAGDRYAYVHEVCEMTLRLATLDLSDRERAKLMEDLDRSAAAARPSQRPRMGDDVAGGRLSKIVGAGTFGTVWLAAAGEDGTPVAVKIFDPDKIAIGVMLWRFQRGIRAMQHLTDLDRIAPRSICRIEQVSGDRLAFSMQFLPGGDLSRLRQLGWSRAKKQEAFFDVANALRFAHAHGVVHRDVKPANVVLDEEGRATLTDFDIADLTFAATRSVASASLGSPHFAAPEQLLDERVVAEPSADIFSLGKLLYFLLVEGPPPLGVSDIDGALFDHGIFDSRLRAAISGCLHARPSDRFQTVDELMDALPAPWAETSDSR